MSLLCYPPDLFFAIEDDALWGGNLIETSFVLEIISRLLVFLLGDYFFMFSKFLIGKTSSFSLFFRDFIVKDLRNGLCLLLLRIDSLRSLLYGFEI